MINADTDIANAETKNALNNKPDFLNISSSF
jgi:hypothetical protein